MYRPLTARPIDARRCRRRHGSQPPRPVARAGDEPRQRVGDGGLTGDPGEQLHQGDRGVPEPDLFRRVQPRGDDPVDEAEHRGDPDVARRGRSRCAAAGRAGRPGSSQHARRQRHVLCDGRSARLGCAGGSAARARQFGRRADTRCPQPGPARRVAGLARARPVRAGDAVPRVGRRDVRCRGLRGREPALRVRGRAARRAPAVAAHSSAASPPWRRATRCTAASGASSPRTARGSGRSRPCWPT